MDAKTNLINSSHSTVNKSEIIEGLHTAQYEYSTPAIEWLTNYFTAPMGLKNPLSS